MTGEVAQLSAGSGGPMECSHTFSEDALSDCTSLDNIGLDKELAHIALLLYRNYKPACLIVWSQTRPVTRTTIMAIDRQESLCFGLSPQSIGPWASVAGCQPGPLPQSPIGPPPAASRSRCISGVWNWPSDQGDDLGLNTLGQSLPAGDYFRQIRGERRLAVLTAAQNADQLAGTPVFLGEFVFLCRLEIRCQLAG
jgi:hypothetical protein